MAGLTQAEQVATLDARFPTSGATDHIGYSTNGTTESTAVIGARTPIGATGWAGATAATPSVKANGSTVTSAAAVGAGTITHAAIFSALSGGIQRTDWQPLSASKTLAIGETLTFPAGSAAITLD